MIVVKTKSHCDNKFKVEGASKHMNWLHEGFNGIIMAASILNMQI